MMDSRISLPSPSTIERMGAILERKQSLAAILTKTVKGLSSVYAREERESAEDVVFDLFKIPNRNEASVGKLLSVLKSYGLREDDPRLAPMMRKVRDIELAQEEVDNETKDPKHWKLTREQFKQCVGESLSIISQTLQNALIIPNWHPFVEKIREIFEMCRDIKEGKVASYIPQLARADPDLWGVALCTIDGQRASFGDSKVQFCVQSVSKAFNYSIAASDLGADTVHTFVGQEPSGRLFNEICLDSKCKPHNPMVNSGAIIVTSLIKNRWTMADRFDYVLTQYRKIAGGESVGFNNATFLSERATADRNYALSYFMKENGCFPKETTSLTDALDFYFQLCSLEATCETMSVMAATLANGGVCPITGEKCIESRPCRDVLSLMYSCGMYDASGMFSFNVGLPAKSGVSGVMIVVVPNLMGIALFSPPLDKMGNSCKGVAFCKELINRFNFHNYDCLAHGDNTKIDPRRRPGDIEKDQVPFECWKLVSHRLYMQGSSMDVSDYDKRTALHVAASEGHYDVVKFLINVAKVRVNPLDRWGRTPLEDAKMFHHAKVAAFLQKAALKIGMDRRVRSGSVSSLSESNDEDDDDFPPRDSGYHSSDKIPLPGGSYDLRSEEHKKSFSSDESGYTVNGNGGTYKKNSHSMFHIDESPSSPEFD